VIDLLVLVGYMLPGLLAAFIAAGVIVIAVGVLS
jgi:hypothetical protein